MAGLSGEEGSVFQLRQVSERRLITVGFAFGRFGRVAQFGARQMPCPSRFSDEFDERVERLVTWVVRRYNKAQSVDSIE